jgi:hypothetical protein
MLRVLGSLPEQGAGHVMSRCRTRKYGDENSAEQTGSNTEMQQCSNAGMQEAEGQDGQEGPDDRTQKFGLLRRTPI